MRSIGGAFVVAIDVLKSLHGFTFGLHSDMKSLHASYTNVLIGLHLVYMKPWKGRVNA